MNRKQIYGRVGVRAAHRAPRRDPLGIIVASLMLAAAVAMLVALILNGGWYFLLLIPIAVLLPIGAVGLAQDLPRRVRDDRGVPIDENRS